MSWPPIKDTIWLWLCQRFSFDYIFCHFCIKCYSQCISHMFGRFYVGLHSAHLVVLFQAFSSKHRHLGRCVFDLNTDREEVIWVRVQGLHRQVDYHDLRPGTHPWKQNAVGHQKMSFLLSFFAQLIACVNVQSDISIPFLKNLVWLL